MRTLFLKLSVGCFAALVWVQASAGSWSNLPEDFQKAATEGRTSLHVDIDNDTLLLNKNDGFYTSGLRFTQRYTVRSGERLSTFGWRLGQELYTASDINLPPALVRPPDHPYAGWLYGGVFKETYRTEGGYFKFGLDLGCLGPCAGGAVTQTGLHRLLRQPLPQAWGKQLKNELGVVLYADIAPLRWRPNPAVDVTPNLHGRFGNIYTDIGAGITLRAGQLNLLPGQSTLHGLLRIDGQAVGYNAALQGGYFSSANPHTVQPKRLVGEAELGLAWNRAPYGMSASIIRRSNEIATLSNALGAQNFVRLQFSYTP